MEKGAVRAAPFLVLAVGPKGLATHGVIDGVEDFQRPKIGDASIAAFLGVAHAMRRVRRFGDPSAKSAPAPLDYARSSTVRARGRESVIHLELIDWIETEGNYLALHAAGKIHLLRETSLSIEGRLDPAQFVRIHRRTLVAIDRIRDISALSNGDASMRLTDGTELRVSRGFREKLRSVLHGRAAPQSLARST